MAKIFSKIKLPLKILITLGLLGLIFQRMDGETLKEASHHVNFSIWALATLFILAQLFFLSWRWMLLINVGRPRMGYLISLQVTLASQIANLLLIPIIAGAVVRVVASLQYGASLFKALFATVIDRIMTLAALSIFCAIFLPSLSHFVETQSLKSMSIFVGFSLLIIFILMPIISLLILPKLPESIISKANIKSGIRYLTSLFNNNLLLAKILIISLMGQLCFFCAVYVIALSAGVTLSFLQLMVVLPAISFISSLPISIGSWGVREGAFVYGLGLLSVSAEVAFSASVQIGLVGIIATIVAGLPALLSGIIIKKFKTHET